MKSKHIYSFLSLLSVAGLGWLLLNLNHPHPDDLSVCPFRWTTGIPCPSCGTTRSAIMIFEGNLLSALNTNPLGFLAVAALLTIPIWLLHDWILQRRTLIGTYRLAEQILRRPGVYIPCLVLLMGNWGWNLVKFI